MQEQFLAEWITLSQKGDPNAFKAIVEFYSKKIFAYVFRILGNEQDAADVVQESFIKAWKYLPAYNYKYRFTTWLYKIATHCSYDYLKKKKHLPVSEDLLVLMNDKLFADNMEQAIINKNIASLISGITSQMTPGQKLVFTLKYLEELDTKEIMIITGMSAVQIKSNLYLAKKFVKEALIKIS